MHLNIQGQVPRCLLLNQGQTIVALVCFGRRNIVSHKKNYKKNYRQKQTINHVESVTP